MMKLSFTYFLSLGKFLWIVCRFLQRERSTRVEVQMSERVEICMDTDDNLHKKRQGGRRNAAR